MNLRKILLANFCLLNGVACGSAESPGIVSTFKSRIVVESRQVLTPVAPAARESRTPEVKAESVRVGRHVATRMFAAEAGGFAADPIQREMIKGTTPSEGKPMAVKAHAAAKVTAPARTTGAFHVEDEISRVAIDATVRGAEDVKGSVSEGYVVYPNAIRSGHWIHSATNDGMQDYVSFDRDTGVTSLSYDVTLTNVASLRLVANSLEFLDAKGAPRLRVPAPYVVGSDHQEHAAKLAVEGCAVDSSPLPPWGRALPAVGAKQCTVIVDWSGVPLTYPAVIDPSWTTTANLANERYRHAAALTNGRVLVAGGPWVLPAEIYDPSTNTWATTGSLADYRYDLEMTALPDGRVLATGGWAQ